MIYTDALMTVLISRHISELNFVSCTTSLFELESFLESIEHDFMKFSDIQTDHQISTCILGKASEQITRDPGFYPYWRPFSAEFILLFSA